MDLRVLRELNGESKTALFGYNRHAFISTESDCRLPANPIHSYHALQIFQEYLKSFLH